MTRNIFTVAAAALLSGTAQVRDRHGIARPVRMVPALLPIEPEPKGKRAKRRERGRLKGRGVTPSAGPAGGGVRTGPTGMLHRAT